MENVAFAVIAIAFDSITKAFHPDDLNKFCLNKKIIAEKDGVPPFVIAKNSRLSEIIQKEMITGGHENKD